MGSKAASKRDSCKANARPLIKTLEISSSMRNGDGRMAYQLVSPVQERPPQVWSPVVVQHPAAERDDRRSPPPLLLSCLGLVRCRCLINMPAAR
jgi:hypothetical protein